MTIVRTCAVCNRTPRRERSGKIERWREPDPLNEGESKPSKVCPDCQEEYDMNAPWVKAAIEESDKEFYNNRSALKHQAQLLDEVILKPARHGHGGAHYDEEAAVEQRRTTD